MDRPSLNALPAEAQQEGVTMALYVCLVLAAEFVAVGDLADSEGIVLATIWATTIGLALAHMFAFDLAGRLFSGGRRRSEAAIAALVQLVAAIAVAATVSVPFLFLPLDRALDVAAFATAALVGVTAYGVARAGGVRHHRAIGHGAIALLIAATIVGVKALLAGP
jgi:hypothetical protein